MTAQPLFGLAFQAVSERPIIATFLKDRLPEAPKKADRFLENNLLYYISPPSMPISCDTTAVTGTVWIPGRSSGLPVLGPEQAHTIVEQVLPQIAHNVYIGQ